MNIERIDITNFRGYEQKYFEFDKHVTVVVGNNTAGKTALLQAVQVALGAYLSSIKTLPADAAYRHNFQKDDVYVRYDEEKRDFFRNSNNTKIEVSGQFPHTVRREDGGYAIEDIPVAWWREFRGGHTTHSHECAGTLMDYVSEMERRRETAGDDAIYPLVLSFGANRIDNQYRGTNKTKERESKIAKAYKSALRDTVDFKSAFDWLYRYSQNIDKGKEFDGTYEALIEALTTALPSLSDVRVDAKNRELMAKVSVRGQEAKYQRFDQMSDGFKSMICMVAEMSYRCIQLNGFLGQEAIKTTPGIVLIDEIDLYLHPRWQRHLLDDLKAAFPNIQFIVTTHSPFIIQSVRTRNLITLDGMTDATDPILRSIEEIAEVEMNMETRRSSAYSHMLEMAEKYYQLVRSQDADPTETDRIKKELDEIETQFSSNPAYVALLRAERKSL